MTPTKTRPPTWATQRRRAIRDGARPAFQTAVERVRARRHRERGLVAGEDVYAMFVFMWLAGGWMPPAPVSSDPPECPEGCGCRWLEDADRHDCGCDGPCCYEGWDTLPDGSARPDLAIDDDTESVA